MAITVITKDVSDNIIAGAVLGSFPLNKRDRLVEYKNATTLTVMGSNLIPLRIGDVWFLIDADEDVSVVDTLDTGAISNGKDYCMYVCWNGTSIVFKTSLATTYPAGFTAANSRKLSGLHTLCVDVGVIDGHSLTGETANSILPASVWDLKHRPLSEAAGMVFSDLANIWADIYLASGTGATTLSVYGGTISDTRDWNDFVDDFAAVKKQLLDDTEFQIIATGSNEETNITGGADPVTTGGHVDTAARRMISNIGCEDCCGVLNQWLRDQSAMYDDAVAAAWYDLPGSKGQLYRPVDTNDVKLRAGGHWGHAARCGSRCRYADYYRWGAEANIGGRGRSRPQ